MGPFPCSCDAGPHQATCRVAAVQELRRALFAGLFDDGDSVTAPLPGSPVRLLDPEYVGEDPASRRFALIETD
jgi:hypothetical protein